MYIMLVVLYMYCVFVYKQISFEHWIEKRRSCTHKKMKMWMNFSMKNSPILWLKNFNYLYARESTGGFLNFGQRAGKRRQAGTELFILLCLWLLHNFIYCQTNRHGNFFRGFASDLNLWVAKKTHKNPRLKYFANLLVFNTKMEFCGKRF